MKRVAKKSFSVTFCFFQSGVRKRHYGTRVRYSGLRFRYTRKSNFKGVDSEFLNLTKIAILRFGHLHEKLHSSENLIMFCKTFLFEFDFTVLGTCYSSSPEALEAIDFVRCEALAGVRGRSPREKIGFVPYRERFSVQNANAGCSRSRRLRSVSRRSKCTFMLLFLLFSPVVR